jgi:hypothetical protein
LDREANLAVDQRKKVKRPIKERVALQLAKVVNESRAWISYPTD